MSENARCVPAGVAVLIILVHGCGVVTRDYHPQSHVLSDSLVSHRHLLLLSFQATMFEEANVICSSQGYHAVPDTTDRTYDDVVAFIRSNGTAVPTLPGGTCRNVVSSQ